MVRAARRQAQVLVAEALPTQQLWIHFPVKSLSLPQTSATREAGKALLHRLSQTAISHCFAFLDSSPSISKEKMQQMMK